jgi:Ferredoxin
VRDAGCELTVRANRTLLDALRDEGVDMMWDCLRGECGLCAATVVGIEGELDHRDVFLSDDEKDEGGAIITCVSRAVGGLITIDTGFRPDAETSQ